MSRPTATPEREASPARGHGDRGEREPRELRREEKRHLAVLGLPTFGLALAITIVSTYLPTVAHRFTTSDTVVGVLIAGEGVGALILPVLVGSWSDGLRTRLGGRLPFVVAGTPVAAAGLVFMGLIGSLWAAGVAVAIFFVGYFVAYEPYRALYPDLVPEEVAGRAQSTQAVWRGAGTGLALLGGGLLLSVGQPVPFAVAALVVVVACAAFVRLAVRWKALAEGSDASTHSADSLRTTLGRLRDMLLHHGPLRTFFFANALWELALAALKTFIILYLTRGLGVSLRGSALLVGGVALIILVGAAFSGKLADRYGRRRVMQIALLSFGVGMLVPFLLANRAAVAASVPFIALGGGVLLSLPYALLIPLMPEEHHGALTGFYSMSRGLGVTLGPLTAGLAVQELGAFFGHTHGYAAMWGVCAAAVLLSIPLLRRLPEQRP